MLQYFDNEVKRNYLVNQFLKELTYFKKKDMTEPIKKVANKTEILKRI